MLYLMAIQYSQQVGEFSGANKEKLEATINELI